MTSVSSVIIALIFIVLAMVAGAAGAYWAIPVFVAVAALFIAVAFLHFDVKE